MSQPGDQLVSPGVAAAAPYGAAQVMPPATLDDTETTKDFASLLPLPLTLEDYASTEKISDLPRKLSRRRARHRAPRRRPATSRSTRRGGTSRCSIATSSTRVVS